MRSYGELCNHLLGNSSDFVLLLLFERLDGLPAIFRATFVQVLDLRYALINDLDQVLFVGLHPQLYALIIDVEHAVEVADEDVADQDHWYVTHYSWQLIDANITGLGKFVFEAERAAIHEIRFG